MQVAKIGSIIFYFFQVMAHAANTPVAAKFDAGGLGQATPVAAATPAPVKANAPNISKELVGEETVSDLKTEKALLSTIESLTAVLANSPSGPLSQKIVLNRAVAANRYARMKVIGKEKYVLTDEVKKYLNLAIGDAELLIKDPNTTHDILIKAYDIEGVSALYLERNAASRESFLKELKLNPPGEKSGRLGLTIAEQDFDQGNYAEAVTFYTQYFSKMTAKWRELSLYKLGWCMINLKDPAKGRVYFLKIADAKSPTGIGRDAIRDLAYLTSSAVGSVPEVVATQKQIPALSNQLIYLEDALANLEALNLPNEHTQVAELLLQIEKDPVERTGIFLSQIRIHRKNYASIPHSQAFIATANYMGTLPPPILAKVMAKHELALELETENIFKAFVDTYVGKVKIQEANPETPEQIFAALMVQFQFMRKFFQSAPHFPIVVQLWENLSLDKKDWVAVDEITQFIISAQPKLNTLLEDAYLNQIAALDELKTDPSRRALRVKEFVEKFPKSARWPQVAQWYAQVEMDAGHFDIALKVWMGLVTAHPSDENFYQLQFCRFKLADYESVLADTRNPDHLKPKSNMLELYREASLKAAEASKSNKDSTVYLKHIEEFIRLSSDPEKARIARLDYLNFMLGKGQLEEAQTAYEQLPIEEKKLPAYLGFRQELWKTAIAQEQYELGIRAAPTEQNRVFSSLLAGHSFDPSKLNLLLPAERTYFLGLYSLFDPDHAIAYLKQNISVGHNRDLLILSYRIKYNQWQLVRTPELENVLGKTYAFAQATAPQVLPVEKAIDAVTFPNLSKMSAARQAHEVEDRLYQVRKYSKSAMKAVVGKSPETQLQIFSKMEQLESNMAHFLVSSPVPAGLTPAQIQQYQEGLKGASEEFVQQSGQFKLLGDKIRASFDRNKQRLDARILPIPEMAKWPWPQGTASNVKLQPAVKLVKNNNLMGGVALLDYLRPTELPSDESFFFTRLGTIFQSKPEEAFRIYLLDELEKNKQTHVISVWATLAGRPIPEAL